MTDEQRTAMSRDPKARSITPSTERILRLRSTAKAMATSQVVAAIAVVALATVIMVPGSANAVRGVVTISSIALGVLLTSRGGAGWLVVAVPAAILWNPISPVYLPRSTWIMLDAVFGGLLLALMLWAGFRRASLNRQLATMSANRGSL